MILNGVIEILLDGRIALVVIGLMGSLLDAGKVLDVSLLGYSNGLLGSVIKISEEVTMAGLSSNQDYVTYMTLKTKGDIQGSIKSLIKCIDLAKLNVEADPSELSFLTQKLGSLRYINGEQDLAFDLYNQSLEIDKGSLLAVLLYAKFLANECHLFQDAILKCDAIINAATASPFLESDNDFGSDYYLRNALELKEECVEQIEKSK